MTIQAVFASTLLLLLCASAALGQAPGSEWARTYGGSASDIGYSVEQTSDGGFFIAGVTHSFGAGNADFYLVKTDCDGNTEWTATFGGSNADYCYSASQTPEGGYILAGCTRSFGAGFSDFYLVKVDSTGYLEWDATYGTQSNDYCHSVSNTSDGGYIMCGNTSPSAQCIYVIKVDSSGSMDWEVILESFGQDIARSIQETVDGGYILAGETTWQGAGGSDFYLLKMDASGVSEWSSTFGGNMWDRSYSVQQTSDGGYILTGYACYNGQNMLYIVKTDESGVMDWDTELGTSGWTKGRSILQTADGGFVVAGSTYQVDFYLARTDGYGVPEWETTFGGSESDYCYALQQTSDGGYILGGGTTSFGAGQTDFWLVKVEAPVGIAHESYESITNEFSLVTVTPNPFLVSTSFGYSLPHAANVEVTVYNMLGQQVEGLVDQQQPSGYNSVTWNGTDSQGEHVPSGIYFVQVTYGDQQAVEKLVLTR